jgi:hypothetical protein
MDKKCINCERNSEDAPLIQFEYKGSTLWICPQDLPLLIHKPDQLTGKFPGAEDLRPAKDL